jgi:hypothetical protein
MLRSARARWFLSFDLSELGIGNVPPLVFHADCHDTQMAESDRSSQGTKCCGFLDRTKERVDSDDVRAIVGRKEMLWVFGSYQVQGRAGNAPL